MLPPSQIIGGLVPLPLPPCSYAYDTLGIFSKNKNRTSKLKNVQIKTYNLKSQIWWQTETEEGHMVPNPKNTNNNPVFFFSKIICLSVRSMSLCIIIRRADIGDNGNPRSDDTG